MLDLLITGGTIVDGTGAPPRTGDLGVSDGRIVAVDEVDEPARRVLDADGLVVAPGFIDLHTHYDAQVLWDGAASPSPLHGVTTIVGGNCGFSVAPLTDDADVDYVRRLMSVVEGIPLSALEQGCSWDWHSFGDYLSRLDDHLVVNAGFLAGHSTIRRAVMGADATEGEATVDQVARMAALLSDSLADGALGFSSGWDNAHYDGDGKAVPSRGASVDEFLALAHVVGRHAGTTIGMFPWMGELPRDRMELMADMSVAADRPVNWNLLGSMSPVEIYEQQLEACDLARERGGRVVALALPDFLRMRASTLLATIPEFDEVLRAPEWERRAAVQDPDVRARLTAAIERAIAVRVRRGRPVGPPRDRRTTLAGDRAAGRAERRTGRGAARDDAHRAAARRRGAGAAAAHGDAADAGAVARRHRRGLARTRRDLGRLPGDARRLRRRRAPRPHVPRQLPDDGAGRFGARPPSPAARGSGAPDDRRAGATARSARPRPHRGERARRPRAVRSRARRLRARDRAATTSRVAASGSTPSRSASRTSSSAAPRS